MNKFIKRIIINIIILFTFIVGVNYYGDPANLFVGSNFYQSMATELADHNLFLPANLDERFLVEKIIESRSGDDYETIVLGSSRTMPLMLDSSLNLSMSGAVLRDYQIIYDCLEQNHVSYNHVLIEISPWIFTLNADNRWRSFSEKYTHNYKVDFSGQKK